MKIVGIGFHEEKMNCYLHHFLRRLADHIPGMIVKNKVPKEADVLIVNLDRTVGFNLFGLGKMPPAEAYTIMVVHEMHRAALPYLKMADLVIFSSPLQERICSELLELNYKSITLPVPSGDFNKNTFITGDCFAYFNYNYQASAESTIIQQIESVVQAYDSNGVEKINCVFAGKDDSMNEFESFKTKLQDLNPKLVAHNGARMLRQDFHHMLEKSICGHYFKNTLSLDVYEEHMSKKSSLMVHQNIADEGILADMLHAGIRVLPLGNVEAFNFNHNNKITYHDYAEMILSKIASERESRLEYRKHRFDHVQVDTLEDLNIIYGAPLNNRYVFSICFRNQAAKIERCLESIFKQNQGLDFGVVLVDDCSNDNSSEVIVNKLSQFPHIPACVVYNKINKRAARNFYNVIHSLTTNPEAVIMEVDGDDFLATDKVLDILENVYSKGALKTNGSYEIYPKKDDYMTDEDIRRHHERLDYDKPWNIDDCNAWLHLRTTKRHILQQIDLSYYMDRHRNDWLLDRHDSAIQPRAIELAVDHCVYIPEVLYSYDLSGDNHDHNAEAVNEYLRFFFHIDKIWHPLVLCPTV